LPPSFRYEEHRIQGVRIVVIAKEKLAPHAHHAGAQHGASSSPLSPHATRHRAQHGATAAAASACASPDGAVAGGAHVLERPTILFVPGGARSPRRPPARHASAHHDARSSSFPTGAFVADFEAADLFFLHEWVRRANATVVYVTYEFAPQAPFPTGLEQVMTSDDLG
jgi:acetyl esterase/lipase